MKRVLRILDGALVAVYGLALFLCLALAVLPALLILLRVPEFPLVFAAFVLTAAVHGWLRRKV